MINPHMKHFVVLLALLAGCSRPGSMPVEPPLVDGDESIETKTVAHLVDTLSDGTAGPMLIVVESGSFLRGKSSQKVIVAARLGVAKTETTVAQFQKFVMGSDYQIPLGCWWHEPQEEWRLHEASSWLSPGYPQDGNHPVSCINWRDAKAYAQWLSEQTGQHYRLPSEAEFEYFNRAGHAGGFAAGIQKPEDVCRHLNAADHSSNLTYGADCDDGFAHTSPVGHFPSNDFGLYDTSGNLWEFTEDCWSNDSKRSWLSRFLSSPTDGSASTGGDCQYHVMRGGSFLSSAKNLQLAHRERGSGKLRLHRSGFRLIREL